MSANFPASGSLGSCGLASRPTLGLAWLADVLAGASTRGHRSPLRPVEKQAVSAPLPQGHLCSSAYFVVLQPHISHRLEKNDKFCPQSRFPPPCWQLPASYVEAGVVWVPGLTPRHLPAVTHQEHGMNLFSKCLEVSQLYLKAETVNHLLVFLFGNLVTKIINEHHS